MAATAQTWSDRRLHLLGIGGSGMRGYAKVARTLGARVSGSDRSESRYLAELRELGVDARAGHDAANLPAGDDVEVVRSSAVGEDNPEVVAARERGLRVIPRAELLHELSALKRTIAVAGAHGKTTTTSMLAHVLLGCGMDPAYLIGGDLRTTGTSAAWGTGEWLVVEADESDRSMLRLQVEIAVVTNVELDHHSTYGSLAEVRDVFRAFLDGPAHAVILDRPELLELRAAEDAIPYDADPELGPEGSTFAWRGHEVRLAVPGAHNARNATAALEAAALAGADPAAAVAALGTFTGAGRRFEVLGTTETGAVIVDDYAHHPTEITATIAAARTRAPRRLVVVVQPHRYSRTQHLAGAFGRALAGADLPVVLDVFPGGEDAASFPGVTGRLVAEAVADAAPGREVLWLPALADAEDVLRTRLREGDLCLVLGAGDSRTLAERLAGR